MPIEVSIGFRSPRFLKVTNVLRLAMDGAADIGALFFLLALRTLAFRPKIDQLSHQSLPVTR